MAPAADDVPELFSPDFYQCPYATQAKLRDEDPVHRMSMPDGTTMWVVTRHEDVRTVFTDPRLRRNLPKYMAEFHGIEEEEGDSIGYHIGHADEPDHSRLRKLVAVAFNQYDLQRLRPVVAGLTRKFLDDMEGQTEVDLIEKLAWPMPISVSCEMFGQSEDEREVFVHWAKAMGGMGSGEPDEFRLASQAVYDRLRELYHERMKDPRDDMLTAFLDARYEGDRFSEDEFVSTAWVLLFAGMETSVSLIGNSIATLLDHLDQMELLRKDRSLLTDAVEEFLRFIGPVNMHVPRIAVEPLEIGGQKIDVGDLVQPSLAAANRDPRRFENPDTFDITRVARGHTAFAHGTVFCLGAPIARMEAEIVVDQVLDRFPNMRLAIPAEELPWRPAPDMRRLLRLPVLL